jgi:resuscitation-promoting factor RpfA
MCVLKVRRGQPHAQRVRQVRELSQERRCGSRISPIFLAEWRAGAKNELTRPLNSAIVILHVGEVRNKPLADDALESQGDAMDNVKISPLAKRLAEENSIDWRLISGTGPEGRVIERDILNYLAKIMSGDADLPTIADVSEPDPGPGADFGALPGLDGVSNLAGASASLAKEGVDLSALLGSAPPMPPASSMPDFDAVPSFDPPAFNTPSFDSSSISGVTESSSSMPSFEAEPLLAGAAIAANDEFDDAIFDLDLDALDDEMPAVAATLEPEPVHVEPVHVEPEPVFQPQIPMPDMGEVVPLALEADPIVPEIVVPEVPAVPAFEFTPEPVLEPVVEPVHVEPVHVEPVHAEPVHAEPEPAPYVAPALEPEPVFEPEPVVPGFQPGYAAAALGATAIAATAITHNESVPVLERVAEVIPAPVVEPIAEPAPWIATPAPTPAELPAAVVATRDFFTLSVLRRTFNPAALKDTLSSLSSAIDGSGVPANAFLARAASRAKLEGATQIALARLEEGQLVTLNTPSLDGSFRDIVTGVAQAGHAASHADLLVMDVANASEEIVVPVQGALLTLDGINGEHATLTLAGKYSAVAGSGFLERVAAALENPLHLMI